MKGPGALLVMLFAVAYPFIVFFGMGELGPRILTVILLAFTLVRFLSSPRKTVIQGLVCCLVVAFCLAIFVLDSQRLLRFYPVLLSFGVAAAFYFSLYDEYTVLEHLAERFGSELHDTARRYIRKLTLWWVVVLLINGVIAAYTAVFATLYQWTLYNGLISYILMGGFMAAELCFRYHYKKSRGITS